MAKCIFRLLCLLSVLVCSSHASTETTARYLTSIQSDPTALTTFFKAMPKGGELHYHLTGGAAPETLLALAMHGDYCLDPKTYTLKSKPCEGIPIAQLVHQPRLYAETLRAWSMQDFTPTPKESGHDHFYATFFKTIPAEAAFRPELLAAVMRRAAKQNELYLEVMVLLDNAQAAQFGTQLKSLPNWNAKKQKLLTTPAFQAIVHQTISESSQLLPAAQQQLHCNDKPSSACDLTIKWQYFVLREQPINGFFAQALNGFIAASQNPNIVGINIVQAEDGPIALHDYRQQMQVFKFLHHCYPKVHIALHAGELAPKVGHTRAVDLRFHIREALLTGHAERIGHGTDINYEDAHAQTLKYMAQKQIPVEINLTSNQTLLNISGAQHPLQTYLNHRVPVVFSTDDEGILRTNLTQQYVTAVSLHHLNYQTIKQINRNSLSYSFLSGASLWQNNQLAVRVKECRHLDNEACIAFIAQSPKAKLQWQLEKQLIQFEHKFR